jgi:hypothetical protein
MFTYIIALLLIGLLIAFSCRMSLVLNKTRTFKKSHRPVRRTRGAVITSPRLQEAIFAINERYQSFLAAEGEAEPEFEC